MRLNQNIILYLILTLFIHSTAFAGITIYLKNGNEITNVDSYEERNGIIILSIRGGLFELSKDDVLKIEEDKKSNGKSKSAGAVETRDAQRPEERPTTEKERGRETQAVPYVMPRYEPSKYVKDQIEKDNLTARLDEVNKRLGEINEREKKPDSLVKEYEEVKLRLEMLFQKGVTAAQAAGKEISFWLQYLNPQEREWVQINSLRKTQIESETEALSKELVALREEKKRLVDEKSGIEGKLRQLEK